MDWMNIIFGAIGVISFGFSIYSHFDKETKKSVEAAKNATQKELLRNANLSLTGILNTVDMIVQLPKKENITVEQMQNFARIARKEAYILSMQMQSRQKALNEWRFGEIIESNFDDDEVDQVGEEVVKDS